MRVSEFDWCLECWENIALVMIDLMLGSILSLIKTVRMLILMRKVRVVTLKPANLRVVLLGGTLPLKGHHLSERITFSVRV